MAALSGLHCDMLLWRCSSNAALQQQRSTATTMQQRWALQQQRSGAAVAT
jgi:hypothetical protein